MSTPFNENLLEKEKSKLEEHRRTLEMVLSHFEENVCRIESEITDVKRKKLNLENLWDKSVEELDLGVRTQRILYSMDIKTLGELTLLSPADLSKNRDAGKRCPLEIEKTLGKIGLKMKENKEKEPCKK